MTTQESSKISNGVNKILLGVFAVVVVVGGGSFYGGMKYAESKSTRGQFSRADLQNLSPEERQQRIQQFGSLGMGSRNGGSGNRAAGGFTSGEILSKDDKSITIKLRDGGSRIIFYSISTEVVKLVSGTASDFEIGKSVVVNGSANQDGSITAQSIQIRPKTTNQ